MQFEVTKCGLPRKMHDLLNTVQKIIKDDQRPNPFKDDRPGRSWYTGFLKRHPKLTEKLPEGISKGRAIVTEQLIRAWFNDLSAFIDGQDCLHILQEPARIF